MTDDQALPSMSKQAIAERLRQAVRSAGGNTAVSARSGVPLGNVNNYLRAVHEMKLDAALALADACGVNLEWLAAGRGPMVPDRPEDGHAYGSTDSGIIQRQIYNLAPLIQASSPKSNRRKARSPLWDIAIRLEECLSLAIKIEMHVVGYRSATTDVGDRLTEAVSADLLATALELIQLSRNLGVLEPLLEKHYLPRQIFKNAAVGLEYCAHSFRDREDALDIPVPYDFDQLAQQVREALKTC